MFILLDCNVIMIINIPTYFTLFRVVMVPCFTVAFYLPVYWAPMVCTGIFFLAAITDWLDGFLARRWKQTTDFGRFLDPVADKIMIITALILIAEHFHAWWMTLPTFSIVIREVVISAVREWLAMVGNQNSVFVSYISKIKTCVQIVALTALLWRVDERIVIIGVIALYISVLLTLWSMFCYLYAARCDLLG